MAKCVPSKTATSKCWLIDSGCTNHMTYDGTLFKELKPTKATKIKVGDGRYISAKWKGIVAITTNSGTKIILDVLYIPEIDQNLLSVGQLLKKGFMVFFKNGYCYIYDAAKSFSFDPTMSEYIAFPAKADVTEIWHKRLGHCHLQRMLKLKKKDLTKGLPSLADYLLNWFAKLQCLSIWKIT